MPGTEAGLRSAYARSFLAKGSCAPPPPTHLITWHPVPKPWFLSPAPLEGLFPTSRTRREARSNSSYTRMSPGLDPVELSLWKGWEATHD